MFLVELAYCHDNKNNKLVSAQALFGKTPEHNIVIVTDVIVTAFKDKIETFSSNHRYCKS